MQEQNTLWRRTKIVCTLGPSSSSEETMRQMLLAGMNVARLNFSHGTHESHGEMIARFRKVRDELKVPVAVMLDTKGPEIRIGMFEKPVEVEAGMPYTFCTEDVLGDCEHCYVNYAGLPSQLKAGDTLLVDDGAISFRVDETGENFIRCTAMNAGVLKSRKGVNVPGIVLDMPFLSEQDKRDLLFGIAQDVDYIAASFTRRADDINQMRAFLKENGGENILIIAKIENHEGVEKYEEIIEAADGIMVARGDMGVEIPFEQLPGIQKMLIKACYAQGKSVITATQMLDSMEENPTPTRAEISDVANAVFDGTSAVMLSGESASGKYPVEAVKVMHRIVMQAEQDVRKSVISDFTARDNVTDNTNAVSAAACTLAEHIGATAIVADTYTGGAARRISKFRPGTLILAATPFKKVYHQMAMIWGVFPLQTRASVDSVDVLFYLATESAKSAGFVKAGDTMVMTAGIPLATKGSTNMLKIEVVE